MLPKISICYRMTSETSQLHIPKERRFFTRLSRLDERIYSLSILCYFWEPDFSKSKFGEKNQPLGLEDLGIQNIFEQPAGTFLIRRKKGRVIKLAYTSLCIQKARCSTPTAAPTSNIYSQPPYDKKFLKIRDYDLLSLK